ncbi:30S ribosomal protein S12 methylthiotransferase RimO [Pectinatus cerevisiiphilus]|uniref:Ribosomal protein uS12 methylthiotransferase RimO n=1 Tax=Pectinatus cerevisiiphilus TaxID=86956 RepID=A0A4R3KCU6_9FIRM|nr:30S ribosomal protein S12 methylthiotransferase RimO [Pectinatus cerevisiiphilus]TCS80870.1 ribosomal protein S12 methylthiotransferase [Pectinatus cerevisiiphilus]
MLRAGFVSLGCSKNRVDTEVMLGILDKNNIKITAEPSEADILIVNTCSFIESARSESVTTILDMAEYKNTGKCRSLIIAGCLGERYGKTLLDEIPEADAVVGTGAWSRIIEAVNATLAGKRVVLTGNVDTIYKQDTPRIITTPSFSTYVKIAEGCNHRCAFCSIPLVRGNYRSRTIEDVKEEVKHLVQKGVKEINLVAQDTTNYGSDLYGHESLAALLRELVKIKELTWVRVQYTYPHSFTDELIEVMASEEKICSYADIPLQHAHNAVLKNMRRSDTTEYIEEVIGKLRMRIPDISLRTTFIVGFPGETDSQYHFLRDFVEKYRFDKVGVFTYSREENTPAYDMANQVPEDIMQERYHDLMSVQSRISEEINKDLEGKIFDVLIEGRDTEQDSVTYGRSYREAPDVDGQIYVENDKDSKPGDIIKVKIMQGFAYDLVGQKI